MSDSSASSDSSKPFSNSLSPKFTLALLNGLVKMVFYRDATISIPFLQEQLFADSKLEADKQVALINTIREALEQAASENWSLEKITEYFQENGFNADQTAAVDNMWKKESKKIHDQLVASSGFAVPHFQGLNWRLDVQSHSRYNTEMNVPSAIVQIDTKSTVRINDSTNKTKDQQIQFELDRAQVANVLLEMEKIEAIMSGAQ